MPARCLMCGREAPCVSVRGLQEAGWQISGRPVGWLCSKCRGPLVVLFSDESAREAKMMVPDFSTKTIVAIVALAIVGGGAILAGIVGLIVWVARSP
jgi:ribosomal protein L10